MQIGKSVFIVCAFCFNVLTLTHTRTHAHHRVASLLCVCTRIRMAACAHIAQSPGVVLGPPSRGGAYLLRTHYPVCVCSHTTLHRRRRGWHANRQNTCAPLIGANANRTNLCRGLTCTKTSVSMADNYDCQNVCFFA